MTEAELFNALEEAEQIKAGAADTIKQAKKDAKEAGLSSDQIKATHAAAKYFVKNNFAEVVEAFELASEKYEAYSAG